MSAARLASIGLCLGLCVGSLPGRGQAADPDARERAVLRDFNAAAALQNAGLYDRAGEKWTAFISQYPGDSPPGPRLLLSRHVPASRQEIRRGDRHFPDAFRPSIPPFPTAKGSSTAWAWHATRRRWSRKNARISSRPPRPSPRPLPSIRTASTPPPHSIIKANRCSRRAIPAPRWKPTRSSSPAFPPARWRPRPATPWERRSRRRAAIPRRSRPSASSSTAGAGQPRVGHGSAAAAGAIALEAEEIRRGGAALCRGCGRGRFPQRRPGPAPSRPVPTPGRASRPRRPCVLADLAKRFPHSPYQSEARLAAGKCYFSAGKFNEAQQILEPLAKTPAAGVGRSGLLAGAGSAQISQAAGRLDRGRKRRSRRARRAIPRPTWNWPARMPCLSFPAAARKPWPPTKNSPRSTPNTPWPAQSLYMAASAAFDDKDYAAARRHAEALLANSRFADNRLAARRAVHRRREPPGGGRRCGQGRAVLPPGRRPLFQDQLLGPGELQTGGNRRAAEEIRRGGRALQAMPGRSAAGRFRRAGQVWAGRRFFRQGGLQRGQHGDWPTPCRQARSPPLRRGPDTSAA